MPGEEGADVVERADAAGAVDEHDAEEEEEAEEFDFWREYVSRKKEKKELRRFPHLARLAVSLVWSAGRTELIWNALLTVVIGVGGAVQLVAIQRSMAAVIDADRVDDGLSSVIWPLVALVTTRVVIDIIENYQGTRRQLLGKRVEGTLTDGVLDACANVDLLSFESVDFHNRVQRAIAAGSFRTMSIVFGILGAAQSVIGILGIAVFLAIEAPLVLALLAAGALPVVLVRRRMSESAFNFHLDETEADRERRYLQQVLTGRDEAKEVRAFDLGPPIRARYEHLYGQHLERYRRHMRRQQRLTAGSTAIGAAGAAVALGALVWMLLTDRLDVAAAAATAAAVQQLAARLEGLILSTSSLYESALFLEDHEQFLALATAARRERPTERVPGPFRELRAESVSFRYPSGKEDALTDVNVTIGAGEVVALVGENGSGKTTLAKILCGLYPPTSGRVLWDGTDMSMVDPASTADHIAVLFQDFLRYELTATDNIGLGRHGQADDLDAVIRAAVQGGADEFLARLPRGYDTVLSKKFKGGRDLSVGQWQRVAMSRAFFRDASFLVLDEPTAALDPRAEHALFERVRALAAGRSVLLISHRFSSVRSADRIYVLDKGRIVEQGNHMDLMERDGLYAELFTLQAKAYLDATPEPVGDGG